MIIYVFYGIFWANIYLFFVILAYTVHESVNVLFYLYLPVCFFPYWHVCHKAAVLATTLKWFVVRSGLFYVYLELIYNFKSNVMLVVCKCWYILWIVQEYDVEDSVLPLQPSLNYTAPEYVRSKASSGGCSSDIFSFGCLAYHLIARKPLFNCNNNVKMVCVI